MNQDSYHDGPMSSLESQVTQIAKNQSMHSMAVTVLRIIQNAPDVQFRNPSTFNERPGSLKHRLISEQTTTQKTTNAKKYRKDNLNG